MLRKGDQCLPHLRTSRGHRNIKPAFLRCRSIATSAWLRSLLAYRRSSTGRRIAQESAPLNHTSFTTDVQLRRNAIPVNVRHSFCERHARRTNEGNPAFWSTVGLYHQNTPIQAMLQCFTVLEHRQRLKMAETAHEIHQAAQQCSNIHTNHECIQLAATGSGTVTAVQATCQPLTGGTVSAHGNVQK